MCLVEKKILLKNQQEFNFKAKPVIMKSKIDLS